MNLENLSVQEMNANEMATTDGGNGFWDFVVDYVALEIIGAVIDASIDHCNNGAGYGGYMDTHGKL